MNKESRPENYFESSAIRHAGLQEPSTEDESLEQAENRRKLEAVFEEIYELDHLPLNMIQGGTVIDHIELHNTGAAYNRPFVVFETVDRHDFDKPAIYKSEISPDSSRKRTSEEILFYQTILPEMCKRLEPATQERITFPKLLQIVKDKEGADKGILLSKLEGEICGTHQTMLVQFTPEDIHAIIDMVATLSEFEPETIERLLQEIHQKPLRDMALDQEQAVDRFTAGYVAAFTQEGADGYLRKAKEIILQAGEIQRAMPPRMQTEDVFGFNMIRLPDGRLGSFDWERPFIAQAPNPGYDYGKLLSRMWSNPEMQNYTVEKILERHRDISSMDTLLRASLISREVPWLIGFYQKIIDGNSAELTPSHKAEAEQAIPALTAFLRDAVDGTGVWAKNP